MRIRLHYDFAFFVDIVVVFFLSLDLSLIPLLFDGPPRIPGDPGPPEGHHGVRRVDAPGPGWKAVDVRDAAALA